MKNKKSIILLIALFFTGFSSLSYELVWVRKLSVVFGANALAVSTVLAIFMAGLALGSLYGGKLIEKSKNPYRFLVWVEFFIGVSSLVTLLLIDLSNYIYIPLLSLFGEVNLGFNLVLFLIYGLILLIPTFFIGAAFPTIIKLYYKENSRIGKSVGNAYAVDTIGSALGVLLVGFAVNSIRAGRETLIDVTA